MIEKMKMKTKTPLVFRSCHLNHPSQLLKYAFNSRVRMLKKTLPTSDEGLTLETSAKHHIPQVTNIPYQPCWSNPYLAYSPTQKNSFFQNWSSSVKEDDYWRVSLFACLTYLFFSVWSLKIVNRTKIELMYFLLDTFSLSFSLSIF